MAAIDHTSTDGSLSLTRRSFLATASAGAVGAVAGCTDGDSGGRATTPRSQRAAGGVGAGFAYKQPAISRKQATHVARTADQLDIALNAATSDNLVIVWIPAGAAINYTGRSRRVTNAVIASSRSINHPGGIIYSNSMGGESAAYRGGDIDGMFELGENARLTGIRLRGPTFASWNSRWFPGFIPFASGGPQTRENFREARFARGVTITAGSVKIDNCEIYGWSTQNIVLECGRCVGTDQNQQYPRIASCSIHDAGLSGYGYGLEVITGHAVIQRCLFNATRHAVAGFGYPSGSYTIKNSVFGPATLLFSVDMHAIGDNTSGSSDPSDPRYRYRAGGLIRVLNCTFAYDESMMIAPTESISQGGNPFAGSQQAAISIGGVPWKKSVVKGNTFVHDSLDAAVNQFHIGAVPTGPHGYANFEIAKNRYGAQFGYPIG